MRASTATQFFALLQGHNMEPLTGGAVYNDAPETAKPFAPYYQEHILPHVQTFEEQRIAALTTLRQRWFKAIPVIAGTIGLAVFFLSQYSLDGADMIVWLCGAIILGTGIWATTPVFTYKSAIKEKVFPHIFRFFGEDYYYSAQNLLSIHSLEPSGIIPDYNGECTEDYVKGVYKEVSLELAEAYLTKTTGSGKNRRTVVKFKGIFILLSMNKNFSGRTIVRRDAGSIGNWLSRKFSSMENVKLEDPVFEKQFEIYSSDQIEARYLLTTSFMERLLELSRLFGDSGIQASFYDDKLLLMIPSKENRFETASIFQPATFVEDIRTILQEMELIFQIIDILKLHQKIGL